MDGENRRREILARLKRQDAPLSAGALAKELTVSRQIIVGDVALLRAGGAEIVATPRGYVLTRREDGARETVACRHTAEETRRELELMVDQGAEVLDVIVEHAVYGQITGQLRLRSRYDVEMFMAQSELSPPLSALTGGVHLHTLRAPSQEILERTKEALREAGFLWDEKKD